MTGGSEAGGGAGGNIKDENMSLTFAGEVRIGLTSDITKDTVTLRLFIDT